MQKTKVKKNPADSRKEPHAGYAEKNPKTPKEANNPMPKNKIKRKG